MVKCIGFVKLFFRKGGYPFGITYINALLVGGKDATTAYDVCCWKVFHQIDSGETVFFGRIACHSFVAGYQYIPAGR